MTEDAVVICLRVAELPRPSVNSQQMLCTECQETVWVSQTSPSWARVVCSVCAPKIVDPVESYSVMTPLQREQMHARGLTDEDIDETMKAADRWLGLR